MNTRLVLSIPLLVLATSCAKSVVVKRPSGEIVGEYPWRSCPGDASHDCSRVFSQLRDGEIGAIGSDPIEAALSIKESYQKPVVDVFGTPIDRSGAAAIVYDAGILELVRGDSERARYWLTIAVALDPDDADYRRILGELPPDKPKQ
jgi:hypothetical protein